MVTHSPARSQLDRNIARLGTAYDQQVRLCVIYGGDDPDCEDAALAMMEDLNDLYRQRDVLDTESEP